MTVVPKAMQDTSEGEDAPERAYAEELLRCIPNPAAARETWLGLGMALHSTGAPWAFEVWDHWSQQYPDKYDARDQKRAWESFTVDGPTGKDPRTFGTVVYLAQQHGYQPPRLVTHGQGRPLPDRTQTDTALTHHAVPDYLRTHPDPRVRAYWKRIYRKTAILKERLARAGALV